MREIMTIAALLCSLTCVVLLTVTIMKNLSLDNRRFNIYDINLWISLVLSVIFVVVYLVLKG